MMITPRALICVFTSLVLAVSATLPARAQLPTLAEQPWLGYFAVHSNSRYTFGIDSLGEMLLHPVSSGSPIPYKYQIKINPKFLETQPGGNIITKRLITDSLETSDTSTDKLLKTTYRGKITGDASFEITVEQERDIIYVTGRMLDSGKIKNPLQLVISVSVPSLYPGELKPAGSLTEREKKREEKALADKLKGDRISLKWTDGKSHRLDTTEGVDVAPEEFNGPGIAGFELDGTVFRKRKILLNASPGTKMTLRKPPSAAFYKGFEILWEANPANASDGKPRLAVQVR